MLCDAKTEEGFADVSGLAGCVKKAKGIFADAGAQSAGCLGALKQPESEA